MRCCHDFSQFASSFCVGQAFGDGLPLLWSHYTVFCRSIVCALYYLISSVRFGQSQRAYTCKCVNLSMRIPLILQSTLRL